jgi:predicted ATPase/DNA-binding winged helix-turn-helix (wHTH) protein
MSNIDPEKPRTRDEVSFGPFRLAPTERLLEKAGLAVPLGGRALDILIVLVEHAGEVVGKRELIERVWPIVTVDEGSLRFHIGALRKALGDGEAGARYVTNVPGRGYCFVEPISHAMRSRSGASEGARFDQTHRLPSRSTRTVGRDETVQTILASVLARRFITIVGPGGIGKTTVAVAVSHALLSEFDGAVCFLDLGSLSDPGLVGSNLASALGLPVGSDSAIPTVINFLRNKRMLLVFDSCEHVIEAVAELSETIFMEVPLVHLLATSREPLRVEGEQVHRLFPLDYPPDDVGLTASEALGFPAVQLFVERVAASTQQHAMLSDKDARTVAEICRKLDGIALAIELAAGRVAVHGIQGTAALLDDRFGLLWQGRRTAPPRQQTLNATLDWSYNLLPEIERVILRRLAVFAGRFSLDAAQAVLTDLAEPAPDVFECIANLVAKSLVTADVVGLSATYRLLDTTRAYGLEKLGANNELDDVARRHAEHYLKLFDGAEADWAVRPMPEWLEIYGRQIDNLRAGLEWAFSSSGDVSLGISLTIASGLLWFQLSLLDECRRRFDQALSFLGGPHVDPRQKMRLVALRSCVVSVSTLVDGRNPLSVVLDLAEALGDDDHRALALWALWASHSVRGETAKALEFAERFRETARATADAGYLATADRIFANLAFNAGNLVESLEYTNKALDRPTGPARRAQLIHHHMDQYVIDGSMQMLILFLQGFSDRALQATRRHYAHAVGTGHAPSQINLLRSACLITLYIGDLPLAESYIEKLLRLSRGHQLGIASALGQCFEAMLMNLRGDPAAALPILRDAIAKYRATRFGVFLPLIIGNLAERLGDASDIAAGLTTIDEAFENAKAIDHHWLVPELLRIRGGLRFLDGKILEAERDLLASVDLAHRQSALYWELRAATSLATLWKKLDRQDEARRTLVSVYDRFTEGFDTLDLKAAKHLLDALA